MSQIQSVQILLPVFSVLGFVFLCDLCNPKAVDQSPAWLTVRSFAPVTSRLTTRTPAMDKPLFAQQPSMWPVWKYRGQAKPLCSGF